MSSSQSDEAQSQSSTSGRSDLSSVLAYLIRSGQIALNMMHGEDSSDDSSDENLFQTVKIEQPNVSAPDTSEFQTTTFAQYLKRKTELGQIPYTPKKPRFVTKLLQLREAGVCGNQHFTTSERYFLSSTYLPNECDLMCRFGGKAFCGTYSKDGNFFLTASQDNCIRIFDTSNGQWIKRKTINARDVGWSILDTAFSPDGKHLIYSSWSDYIHICKVYGEQESHNALHLFPEPYRNFCIFSLQFSCDSNEIIGGANDGHLYVFDLERNERILKIDAHDDDTNAVCFADDTSKLLFSGGDDGLVKVWDRRTLRESEPSPVGVLAGHCDGITFIDTKGDGRYLLSNSKDQSIKLWDIRKFSSQEAVEATKKEVSEQSWDYRWQKVPLSVKRKWKALPGDTSIMTYRGHSVLQTLVRARFSPDFSTGQRYICTGCGTGALVIYDVLTGEMVKKLDIHNECVRDVSWHPFENTITTSSWDCTIGRWRYTSMVEYDTDEEPEQVQDEHGKYPKRCRILYMKQQQKLGREKQNKCPNRRRTHVIL